MSMRDIDFGLAGELGVGFSGLRVCKSEILATGVRRESRAILARQRGVSPTTLRGRSAEASGDELPVVAMDAGGGQVQHDAPHRGLDPGTELHEVFAQRVDLSGSEGGARGPQAQLLIEHVGGGGEESPQLISEEAGATGAVDFQAVVQFLDPVFDVPAGAVDAFVQIPRGVLKVRDYKARVVLRLAVGMAHDFGLDNDAPALIPGAGRISALLVEMLGLAGFARQTPGGGHQARRATLENLVFGHRDHGLESFALAKVQ